MQLLICGYSGCNSISGCSEDYIMNLPRVGHQKIVCSFIEQKIFTPSFRGQFLSTLNVKVVFQQGLKSSSSAEQNQCSKAI